MSEDNPDKPGWDIPTNVAQPAVSEAGTLAKKHGISPDRAQMLIDRFGHDPVKLEAEARSATVNPKR